jgi:hypothetical protein
MVNANVLRAIGEVLQSHGITPKEGEQLADTVARTLDLSDSEAQRWLEALSEGCPVEEANRRAGIASRRDRCDLLVKIARAIGSALGKVAGQD